MSKVAANDTGYIITYSGRKFFPLAPDPDDVCIKDIAHALSMKCRYTGHTRNFYSVAEHSVLMAEHLEKCGAPGIYALLHDAPEAYLPDVPGPVKRQWDWWPMIEGKVEEAIMEKFNLFLFNTPAVHEAVKLVDQRILLTEAERLFDDGYDLWGDWTDNYTPLPVNIRCWTPARAKDAFLGAFAHMESA